MHHVFNNYKNGIETAAFILLRRGFIAREGTLKPSTEELIKARQVRKICVKVCASDISSGTSILIQSIFLKPQSLRHPVFYEARAHREIAIHF